MKHIAVVYWSGTGNTAEMAKLIAGGAKDVGAEVTVFSVENFKAEMVTEYDKIAYGCPSMGAEALEETEFEPLFIACESYLHGKQVALFGSYGWGDGEWMRNWENRCREIGVHLYGKEGLIVCEAPDGVEAERCVQFGRGFAD